MKIAGFDIGGANTDLAIVDFDHKGEIKNITSDFEYLPMWSNKEDLGDTLLNLIERLDNVDSLDGIGISMTAELVDAYSTKEEGVLDIAKKVKDIFDLPIAFIGINGVLSFNELKNNPLEIAAANWIATAQIASKISSNCIFIDIGSTTTDIIPIKNGKECAKGRSDFERLGTGELVYTGTLRTDLATFVDEIPLKKNNYTVASELFAISADVFRVLGKITEEDYVCNTCDGKGKSIKESARRISRILCADLEMLSMDEIIEISKYIHEKQVKQIAIGLKKVSERENLDLIITTGLGKDILGSKAAKQLNLNIKSMNDILTDEECVVAPAIGTAILLEKYLKQ
ncbi:hydantoinase/oxoprolinase [Methanobrevibacter cuticularis]|uniref:Hydantoinase/oxoprolinase n=1 Tax=Methanobrevibacter cuticularis TaxID=47311 RepID=A0A166CXN9_9EURY|nr:hydantoinase/oxoprolinase family protein [Methanobrevibacter cuticularis]KZX14973.1 hydantoinase/oxoprolinase [Methanobrevibacter cuticularis]